MSMIKFGATQIDPVEYGSVGNAVLGIRDSGKSYTATFFAEQLQEKGVPFTAFDPTGVWRFLRVPGKNGHGFPIVIAGGEAADLPLNKDTAPAIVEAAMQQGISLVIDLHTMELSKADWRRIVRECVRLMLFKNKQYGLRHIFLEEAAEFAPQKVIDGDVYAEIEKLARMGGNSRLGYTLINQRAEEVNKAVLELCDNLFLHRQKGKNSLMSLAKWLDAGDVANAREITKTLSTLPTGECWAWLRGSNEPVHVKVPRKQSFHPDRRALRGEVAAQAKAVDVGGFVAALNDTLPKVVAEAEANDPKKLKAALAAARQEIEQLKQAGMAAVSKDELAAEYQRGHGDGRAVERDSLLPYVEEVRSKCQRLISDAQRPLTKLLEELQPPPVFAEIPPRSGDTFTHGGRRHVVVSAIGAGGERPQGPRHVRVSKAPHGVNGTELKPAEQKVLDAIAWWISIGTSEPTREQVCAFAGYSTTASTIGVYLASLKRSDMVEYGNGGIRLTATGEKTANHPDAPPTHSELRERIKDVMNPAEVRVMKEILHAWPRALSREALCDVTGYSTEASTIGVYLGALRRYGFVERREIKAADWLFR